jgi:thiol-disulfide isomerase/thioredoxin
MATATPPKKYDVDIVTFANSHIKDEKGADVKVGTLWKDHPVIFVFLRHFGCIDCRAHAAQIWSEKEKYEKGGAQILFISNGAPQFIQGFKEELKITEAPVYTDPSLAAFKACGFKRGFLAALGPQSLINGMKLKSQGHKNKREPGSGDWWQMGGILVVQKDGKIGYHHICQTLADYPSEIEEATP